MLSFVIVPRLRAVSLFSWSVEQNARDTQMTTRVTEGARQGRHNALVSRVSRLRRSTLARACTPLTKSEEKERLLAGHIVPSWQISFACELKQRRRQRKRQKGTRDLISQTTTLQCITLFGTSLCRHCTTMNMVLNHLNKKFMSLHTRKWADFVLLSYQEVLTSAKPQTSPIWEPKDVGKSWLFPLIM